MSISAVSPSAAATIQELAQNIMARFDANQDQQLSFQEFASFLDGFTQSIMGTKTTAAASGSSASATNLFLTADSTSGTTGAKTYHDRMLGFNFDLFETGRGSTKYDAARILQFYDPADPDAMKKVHAEMEKLYPGSTSLDIHNDLMLDGTADGYIGRRPINREENWDNPPSGWAWQWMAYNTDHVGPDGEGHE